MKDARPSKSLIRVWAIVFVIVLIIVVLLLLQTYAGRNHQSFMRFVEGRGPLIGTLTIMDGEQPVLTYRYGDQLPPGLDAKQARSCYIHPLYALDGAILSSDFPSDHLHHHGVFWTWPSVLVRGVVTQTWHPAEPSLRQHFVKWIKREADSEGAVVAVENTWKLRESEDVAEETVTLRIHGASRFGRAIDVEIILRPVGGPLELRGAAEENKGYGGLCFRGAPLLKDAVLTTDEGLLKEDSTGRPFRWADLSTPELGVALFVSPDHPGYPIGWLVRGSYAGILNPSWPGLAGTTLATNVPVTLRYRVYIHRGDAASGRVEEAYVAYSAGRGL